MSIKEITDLIPKDHKLTLYFSRATVRLKLTYGTYESTFNIDQKEWQEISLEKLKALVDKAGQIIQENRKGIQANKIDNEDEADS